MEERLQKILSACGAASRRTAECYLSAGRVTVNGMPARVGDKADPERDDIRLDGRSLTRPQARTYLMLHKPRGYVTTLSDEKGRRTVAELVRSCGARVWPVGRLDLDKEYRVWVNGDTAAGLPVLRGPMSLDGVPLRPARVTLLEQTPRGDVLSVVIHEGKNRQVRRMCDAAGLTVKRLVRVREGALALGALPSGRWRRLTGEEIALLQEK